MDKKQKTEKNIVIFVMIIISIIGLGYLLSGSYNSTNNGKNSSTQSDSSAKTTENVGGTDINTEDLKLDYKGKIVYLQKSDESNDICVQEKDSNKKVVFTDKDEELKIKSVKSITTAGQVLAVLAPNDQLFGGKLYLISIDGSGKKELLINEFASPQAPIISSDAKLIAYVLFSNIEEDFGFSLNLINIYGKNKLEIDHDDSLISHPVWSPDSKNIAYIKGNNPSMKVFISDSNSQKQSEIYSIDANKTISGLSWGNQNKIILTLTNLKNYTGSEIISIDVASKKAVTLLEDKNNSLSEALWADEKLEKFFFLKTDSSQQENKNLNIGNSENASSYINTADSIVGWTGI